MADKALLLQKQIRENSQELGDFLGDLNKWEHDIKKKDEELKRTDAIEKLNVAPIRKTVKKEKKKRNAEAAAELDEQKNIQPKSRISSYDYDSWSKFDVDAECEKVDKEEEDTDSEESEEEVDLEAAQEVEEQRRLQRAILEKDKGNDLFKEGKYEAAINRYTLAAELDPRNAIVFANRAMALLKVERYAAAEADCTRSLSIDSEYAKAVARRATARTKLKKFQEAIEDQEHLIILQPNNKQAKTELEKIKKELQKKESETSKSEKRRRRSNKPVKRIIIEEIGSDEERSATASKLSSKTNLSKHEDAIETQLTVKSNGQKPKISPSSENNVNEDLPRKLEFEVPTSPVQFETDFQKIKKNIEEFYKYFSAIPTDLYKSLFHHSIDDVLPRALECFHKFYEKDGKEYREELLKLAEVPRFDMARMFLPKSSKIIVQDIFKQLLNKDFANDKEKSETYDLAKKYGFSFNDS